MPRRRRKALGLLFNEDYADVSTPSDSECHLPNEAVQRRLQGQRVGEKEGRKKKGFSLTIVTHLNLMVKH